MRFNARTPIATSVARRASMRDRSVPPDHPLVSTDVGFHQRAVVIAGRFLPTHATALGNELQMLVTLRRRGVGRLGGDRARTRRSDDCCIWIARRHLAADVVSVVCAVTDEGCDGTPDLVEQRVDLQAIVHVFGGQRGRHDLAGVGVNAKVQLPPRPSRLRAVLLHQPLTGAAQPQAGAVDKQMHGRAAQCRSHDGQGFGSPAQRRVIGHGEIKTEQADD